MKRTKIGKGYYQSGHGLGFKKNPIIYLIDGKAYAKDKANSDGLNPLKGELAGYVRVNYYKPENSDGFFTECSDYHKFDIHKDYKA